MDNALIAGFAYLVLGAICGGSFGLPSKYVPKETPWENLWGPFFALITIVMPLVAGPLWVRDFFAIYVQAGVAGMAMPLLFGFLWGAGSMTLGLSFAFIGLSLAYALNYGAQIIFGSLSPMILHHRERMWTAEGGVVLAGVGVCLLGVVICGRAGILKDRSVQKDAAEHHGLRKPSMLIGLLLAVASGVLCACYATAASCTADPSLPCSVEKAAVAHGNQPWQVSLATTAVILWGGALSSCAYCAMKLTKNRTWRNFAAPGTGRVLLVALLMAVLHNGTLFLLNLAFPLLGALGVSVGYAVLMSCAIIVGNAHGFRTGEWKGASRQSIRWIVAGIAVLLLGVCILAQGRAMAPKPPSPEAQATWQGSSWEAGPPAA